MGVFIVSPHRTHAFRVIKGADILELRARDDRNDTVRTG